MALDARTDAAKSNLLDVDLVRAAQSLEDFKAQLETAKGRYRKERNRLKGIGINLAMLDAVLLLKRRDADEVLGDQRDFIRYARVMALPIGTQLSLLDDNAKPELSSDEAEAERKAWDAGNVGYLAGKNGEPNSNCPYPPETIAGAAWLQGHRRGKALLDEGLVAKRGRPRKEAAEQAAA